jgi:sec-independent protein translocase protein TatA
MPVRFPAKLVADGNPQATERAEGARAMAIGKIVLIVMLLVLIFGAGKLPRLMGQLARGLGAFASGLRENAAPPATRERAPGVVPPGAETRFEAANSNVPEESGTAQR